MAGRMRQHGTAHVPAVPPPIDVSRRQSGWAVTDRSADGGSQHGGGGMQTSRVGETLIVCLTINNQRGQTAQGGRLNCTKTIPYQA